MYVSCHKTVDCRPLSALQLGAQRNDLFGEMQELLKQQQDEVVACRAALALGQQDAAAPGTAAASSGMSHLLSTTRLYNICYFRRAALVVGPYTYRVPVTYQYVIQ